MRSQTPEMPTGAARAFFGILPRLYRGWFSERLLARNMLVLETTGRRTGLPRRACLDFVEGGGRYYVATGWGTRCLWYQNLKARPQATVRLGRRQLRVTAAEVTDPVERRRILSSIAANSKNMGPPPPVRGLMRTLHVFDYERAVAGSVQRDETQVIQLTPTPPLLERKLVASPPR